MNALGTPAAHERSAHQQTPRQERRTPRAALRCGATARVAPRRIRSVLPVSTARGYGHRRPRPPTVRRGLTAIGGECHARGPAPIGPRVPGGAIRRATGSASRGGLPPKLPVPYRIWHGSPDLMSVSHDANGPDLEPGGAPLSNVGPSHAAREARAQLELTALRTLQHARAALAALRSEEHTSELQSLRHLVCRL